MKKILLISTVLAAISSSAFAKTEGNYATISALYNRASVNGSYGDATKNSAGVGIGYKYAFNFDKFFVAPGVFGEKNNGRAFIGGNGVDVKNRYGAKVDLGVDLEDDLAVYVTGGVSMISYSANSPSGRVSNKTLSDFFYGAGISHDYSKTVSFNLEYNTQSFAVRNTGVSKTHVDNNVVKLGLSYKF